MMAGPDEIHGGIRTEVIGSLLRPRALLAARRRHAAGELGADEFKRIEDAAVAEAVALQEQVGIGVVSDGELRRRGWMTHFTEAVDGFEPGAGPSLPWRGVDGPLPAELRGGMRPVVVAPLRRRHFACAEEWTSLRARAGGPAKVTLVSAEMAAAMYEPERSRAAYPTREAFLADVVELLRGEVAEAVRLGCTYVQLDAPQYGALLDPATREVFRSRGADPDRLIDAGIEADNAVIAGFPGVTFGLHVCRGNNQSRHYAEGDYGPLARLFERSAFGRLLLEYDDQRSGGFEPLASVPEDRVVVLGLVTTKHGGLEDAEELRRRIAAASRFVPLERLALSPQCGFASMMEGNEITPADQRRKLELVVSVARSVWG
jgi:5-methyltetrahydropteroyltriglutamate--homocysteine methyltransferase